MEGYRIRFDGGQYKSTVGLDLVDMPTNNGRILRRFLLFLCLEKDPKMAKNRPMMLIRAMTTAQETRLLQARQILKLTWKTIAMILLTRHFRPKQETGQRSSKNSVSIVVARYNALFIPRIKSMLSFRGGSFPSAASAGVRSETKILV